MESGLMMLAVSWLDVVVTMLVGLIPIAIWQRTKITGFAIVGATYFAGAVLMVLGQVVLPFLGSSMAMLTLWRVLGLGITLVAAYGFWRVYEAVRVPAAAPHA